MEIPLYVLEVLAQDRITRARAWAARDALRVSRRSDRHALRRTLGLLLIRIGRRLAPLPLTAAAGRRASC